jgi:hypothetical protein
MIFQCILYLCNLFLIDVIRDFWTFSEISMGDYRWLSNQLYQIAAIREEREIYEKVRRFSSMKELNQLHSTNRLYFPGFLKISLI